ncbi:unnamed protein product [Prorocentrum cordatum]|uniref:Uncharacterized protein n=1 Tax=Prorocentrum cordatum TaxID=2364126 RepID=A0ABN9XTP1_9DINO|nr:unnamed protein product [Polarella glacialis]
MPPPRHSAIRLQGERGEAAPRRSPPQRSASGAPAPTALAGRATRMEGHGLVQRTEEEASTAHQTGAHRPELVARFRLPPRAQLATEAPHRSVSLNRCFLRPPLGPKALNKQKFPEFPYPFPKAPRKASWQAEGV